MTLLQLWTLSHPSLDPYTSPIQPYYEGCSLYVHASSWNFCFQLPFVSSAPLCGTTHMHPVLDKQDSIFFVLMATH